MSIRKTIGGHVIGGVQPIGGKADVETFKAAYHESSVGFISSTGQTLQAGYHESSQGFLVLTTGTDTPLGQTICVPDGITRQGCTTIC